MNLVLFITVLMVSFIVVRIGAVAFQLTGLEWSMAKFQALSCFTSTGFTTKEAELITSDSQRRRIASILIVLGHAGLVTMVATLANSLRAQELLEASVSKPIVPFELPAWLVPLINFGIIVGAAYGIYKVSTSTNLAQKFTNHMRRRLIRREAYKKVTFEELLIATGGYGVTRVAVQGDSKIVGKTLIGSELRRHDITVLAVVRGAETIANPVASTEIQNGDELICFGKLENIRREICGSR